MQLYVVGYKDMFFFLKYQEILHFFARRLMRRIIVLSDK